MGPDSSRYFANIFKKTEFSLDDLDDLLPCFGLNGTFDDLREISQEEALESLIFLIWKDLAYGVERMSRAQAEELANLFFSSCHAEFSSRFFTNGRCLKEGHFEWFPMTEFSFDRGVIMLNPDHSAYCLWYISED